MSKSPATTVGSGAIMNSRKTVRRLERCSEARQDVVMPCQGNMLSGSGHSILHDVSDVHTVNLGFLEYVESVNCCEMG